MYDFASDSFETKIVLHTSSVSLRSTASPRGEALDAIVGTGLTDGPGVGVIIGHPWVAVGIDPYKKKALPKWEGLYRSSVRPRSQSEEIL